MKLANNLESGNYTNKLILSFVSNPYMPKAIMASGQYFNYRLKDLETATNKIERFKKSPVAPAASMNTTNIEDKESDYEIKLWLDPTDKAAYYYTEPEKVYLNADSSRMFRDLSSLISLNLSSFDTSQVTNMNLMFYVMSNLTSLDLSNFDTSKVTNMVGMFSYMSNLTALDLSNFNTSKVTHMQEMFSYMSNLATLDLSSFDTSQVTDMQRMFFGMSNLTSLDLSNFNTSKVDDMLRMFALDDEDKLSDKLETIYVNNDFNTAKLISFSNMFRNRKKLRGGNGSYLADPSTADETWLRIDDPAHGRPGYFTRKP